MANIQEKVAEWNRLLEDATPQGVLKYFMEQFPGKVMLASSLSAEDQIITKMMSSVDKKANIITLDTGRLFPETYDLIDKTNEFFGIKLDVYFPDYHRVEAMVKEHGINLFYHSLENRKLCCKIRKIEPLKRSMEGMEAWVTGLRRAQSVTRVENKVVEWDEGNQLIKINPLIEWTEQDVWDYVKKNNIPYNILHDQNFPSIGCQPCTRAVEPGEDVRAGRWWWEEPEKKECGLHNTKDNNK